MTKKFGTMFDDDEDMTPVSPSSSSTQAEKSKAPAPVLLNDEARALLDEKAKAAGERAKAAAQKSVAMAGRAAAVVRERASKIQGSASRAGSGLSWGKIAAGLLTVSIVGGAIAWLVLSKDQDNAEPSPAVVPVTPPSVATPVEPAAVEAPAPRGHGAPLSEPESTEAVPEALVMPVMGPAAGRYVPPAMASEELAAPVVRPEAAPVVSPLEQAAEPVAKRPAPIRPAPEPAVLPIAKPATPRSEAAPKPTPAQPTAPVGEREQQQIDQIKALFGDER